MNMCYPEEIQFIVGYRHVFVAQPLEILGLWVYWPTSIQVHASLHMSSTSTWLLCHHSFVSMLCVSLYPDSWGRRSMPRSRFPHSPLSHAIFVMSKDALFILFIQWFFCFLNFQVRARTYLHKNCHHGVCFPQIADNKACGDSSCALNLH